MIDTNNISRGAATRVRQFTLPRDAALTRPNNLVISTYGIRNLIIARSIWFNVPQRLFNHLLGVEREVARIMKAGDLFTSRTNWEEGGTQQVTRMYMNMEAVIRSAGKTRFSEEVMQVFSAARSNLLATANSKGIAWMTLSDARDEVRTALSKLLKGELNKALPGKRYRLKQSPQD